MSWQDGEGGRLERFVQEIAIEVVTTPEIGYRERCVRAFEWRVRRKAKLEEDARNYQLQLEREARERQQQLEQARIDRLLDEAAALCRATDIRDYVGEAAIVLVRAQGADAERERIATILYLPETVGLERGAIVVALSGACSLEAARELFAMSAPPRQPPTAAEVRARRASFKVVGSEIKEDDRDAGKAL